MTRQDIISLLGDDWTCFENMVRERLASDIELLDNLNSGLLDSSGKRLRPMIALLTARALGTCCRDSICFAAATEMIHNATLFHDDVADGSATRRGKPTLVAMMGPEVAVLVGDFWLARAISTINGTVHELEAVHLYSRTISDLAEGEMLQLQKAVAADTGEEDYLRIIFCKTASLFESACRVAAVSVDAPRELMDAATRFGRAFGMAFQIRDDILDYGDPAVLGKPVGQDLRERKITLPLLGALAGSPREAEIRAMVAEIPSKPGNCVLVQDFVRRSGGLEYAAKRLEDFVAEALSALEAFPDCPEKDALAYLARYNSVRAL